MNNYVVFYTALYFIPTLKYVPDFVRIYLTKFIKIELVCNENESDKATFITAKTTCLRLRMLSNFPKICRRMGNQQWRVCRL
jgi:hypothetical protein